MAEIQTNQPYKLCYLVSRSRCYVEARIHSVSDFQFLDSGQRSAAAVDAANGFDHCIHIISDPLFIHMYEQRTCACRDIALLNCSRPVSQSGQLI